MTNQSPSELIEILYRMHLENSDSIYFAKKPRGPQLSTMPITPFVFEFFLYNSIYQIDWEATYLTNSVTFHPDEIKSSVQKRKLNKFIKTKSIESPAKVYRAFHPLTFLPPLTGDWTSITPDARVSQADGTDFFERIEKLKNLILDAKEPNEICTSKKLFGPLESALDYLSKVRNNIFHGSKKVAEIYEDKQRRRVEVYETFLKCYTSLFFLLVKDECQRVASDSSQCGFNSAFAVQPKSQINFSEFIREGTKKGLMRPFDKNLISAFEQEFPPSDRHPTTKSSLVCPQTNPKDLLTALWLALPYCTQFFFFNWPSLNNLVDEFKKSIEKFLADNQKVKLVTVDTQTSVLEFPYQEIDRSVSFSKHDELDSLIGEMELSFYFDRRESERKVADWMTKLESKISQQRDCLFITVNPSSLTAIPNACPSKKLDLNASGRLQLDRNYIIGTLQFNDLPTS
ncbi:hypothetical protein N9006_00365 [bacterium]|nr:hypothetical protein [bacterium]